MDDLTLDAPFDFLRDPQEIFKALLESKERSTAVGIKTPILGKGMFVTRVEDILLGDGQENTRIILTGYDFTGHVLETNAIMLTDIEGVCKFASKFENPFIKTLSKILKV